ncbi:hypothetical protein [Marinobacter sp.]
MPEYTGKRWADLADHALQLDSLLQQCNGDKALIRQWADHHNEAAN